MPAAIDHKIRTKTADNLADSVNPGLRCPMLLDRHSSLHAELAAQRESWILRCSYHDDAARTHLLGGSDHQHANRTRTLDDHGISEPEAVDRHGAVECADTAG